MQELIEALLRSNILWEKKWVACGDSFTEGDFSDSDEEYTFADGLTKQITALVQKYGRLQ